MYKIWRYAPVTSLASGYDDPSGLNYKTGLTQRLHPKVSFVKGELVSADYYSQYDGTTYGDLVLRTTIVYNRNADGVLTSRVTTRQWTVESDEADAVFGPDAKVTEKFYTITQAAVADQRRRSNIVDNLVAKADPSVVSYVKTMFRNLDNEINSFKATGDTRIIEKISSYSGAWLNVVAVPAAYSPTGQDLTLRQAIIGQLML